MSERNKTPTANETTPTMSNSTTENIKVAVRLRPFTEKEKQRHSKRCVDIEQNTVALYSPKYDENIKRFTFDHSYWSHDGFKRSTDGLNVPDEAHLNCSKYVGQEQVFADLGRFLLDNALKGYNSALLAYGQTGSGKSYTVSGYGKNEGILPRFARELFNELLAVAASDETLQTNDQPKGSSNRFEVYFSMIEIYNEVVRDLLAKETGGNQHPNTNNSLMASRRNLRVREHPKRGFFVENLTSLLCANKEEIERLIEEGQLNKSIAATSMNETSSRGHTIYEFRIKQFKSKTQCDEIATTNTEEQEEAKDSETTPTAGGPKKAAPAAPAAPACKQQLETLTTSVVQLVDLAGSERMAVHVTGSAGLISSNSENFMGSRSSSPAFRGGRGGGGGDDTTTNSKRSSSSTRRPPPSSAASVSSMNSTGTGTGSSRSRREAAGGSGAAAMAASNSLSVMSSNHQQRFKESVSINQSLSALGNCIQVLSQYSQQQLNNNNNYYQSQPQAQAAPPKIPYRDSVLTKLLNRCCLSGKSKVAIIATLSPADSNYDDTLSTLRFADRAKQIRTHATINRLSRGEMVNALQRENERLKQILDGRVTRSDDSSQTSNFDDSENMQENFNGPSKASPATGSATKSKIPSRTRTSVARKEETLSKASGPKRSSGATASNTLKNKRNVSRSTTRLDTTGAGGDRMKQLVSPASSKTAGRARNFTDQEDKLNMRKSRSLSRGLDDGDKLYENENHDDDDVEAATAELELVSGLLEDIELNDELAHIEDENLLSPDSDNDSFASPTATGSDAAATGSASALDEARVRNEEKISILNKLLNNNNNSNGNGKMLAQQESVGGGAKLLRPKKAGAMQRMATTTTTTATTQRGGNASEDNAMAISSPSMKRTNPYLSNLNPDEQLTGMISYIIKPGEMIIGKNANECDLLIYGPELRGRHAKFTRIDDEQEAEEVKTGKSRIQVYIEPIAQPQSKQEEQQGAEGSKVATDENETNRGQKVALFINGQPVLTKTKLNHCDRLLFGSNAYFVFIDNTARNRPANGQQTTATTAADTLADLDLITYDMAHNEVLRKIMSDAQNEAVVREIQDYTHRPGTGKRSRVNGGGEQQEAEKQSVTSGVKLSGVRNTRLTRSMTIHDNSDSAAVAGAEVTQPEQPEQLVSAPTTDEGETAGQGEPGGEGELAPPRRQLGEIKEEEPEVVGELSNKFVATSGAANKAVDNSVAEQVDESYREKLLDDTYEFAMPVAEANAIAKEMGIKVTYGLKILTGEEQLLLGPAAGDDGQLAGDDDETAAQQRRQSSVQEDVVEKMAANMGAAATSGGGRQSRQVVVVSRNSIRAQTLDIPPELYIHVHLEELELDFYWSKEKFQERRVKMLELYGAWDVGGKSGLVEYLIEQSKYQGYYMIDPFIDDLHSECVLVGHAQVILRPISHLSDLRDSFDILDVNDEIVGSLQIEAVPCHPAEAEVETPASNRKSSEDGSDQFELPYRVMSGDELRERFIKRPEVELLGQKLVFMLKLIGCTRIPDRYARVYCQYTLNRDQSLVRTEARELATTTTTTTTTAPQTKSSDQVTNYLNNNNNDTGEAQVSDVTTRTGSEREAQLVEFNHTHFVVLDKLDEDTLDFLQHGFLTIQLVGQYRLPAAMLTAAASANSSTSATSQQAGSSTGSRLSGTSSSNATPTQLQQAPTLISTIINSINKYRFRMEHQAAEGAGASATIEARSHRALNHSGSIIYANSLTDSGRSHRITSSGLINSGASSITSGSASATINLFDQQQEDDDGGASGSLNGNSQENIIDMILTKRKLDRAENQLHYLKRTINIAEHYNRKNIPIKTVKKLLNTYGHELEGGSLEEIATDVTSEGKTSGSKQTGCSIQ